jgi:putative ABC transport system permease protein
MPGVLVAEPFRSVPAILRNGHRERRLAISGIADGAELTRVLDAQSRAVEPPGAGLMLSRRVADLLRLEVGDLAEVVLLEHDRRVVLLPVTSLVESLVGLAAYARNDVLDRLVGDGRRLAGVRIAVDEARLPELYAAVKRTPAIASIALQGVSRARFREMIEENIGTMMGFYVGFALIITFGIVYNSARIQLSERARELASLRVLGFSRAEVSSVLLFELGVVVVLAQPLGWLLGHLFSLAVVKGFESDLFRIPFVIDSSTYAASSLIVIAAAAVSALIVRRRIDRLDLVEVLKTRE